MDFTPLTKVQNTAESIAYSEGSVVSKMIIKRPTGNVTLFSFDKDQGLSEHTAPFDALVQIIDGEALITLGGKDFTVKTGEHILMPAGVPHALKANVPFKMVLTMIKG